MLIFIYFQNGMTAADIAQSNKQSGVYEELHKHFKSKPKLERSMVNNAKYLLPISELLYSRKYWRSFNMMFCPGINNCCCENLA